MKKTLFIFTSLLLMLVGCGNNGNDSAADESLSPKERDAVKYVRNHLNKGEKIKSVEVYTGAMPVELMTDEYKRYRDDVFKAGLDYVNCLKRGLQQPAEKKAEEIEKIQNEIVAKIQEWRQEQGTSEYLFILADVQNLRSSNHPNSKLIAVFNPATMQNDFWFPLTTVFLNNASMILNAENGTLFQYATDANHDMSSMIGNVTNPVLKFIFNADSSTLK